MHVYEIASNVCVEVLFVCLFELTMFVRKMAAYSREIRKLQVIIIFVPNNLNRIHKTS